MRIAAAFLFPVFLMAQGQTTTHTSTSATKTTKPAAAKTSTTRTAAVAKPETIPLSTEDEKTLYAVGLSIYHSLGQFNLSPAELKVIEQAMNDAAANKPAVDIEVYGPKIQALVQTRAGQIAEKQKAEGGVYLAKAAGEPGAVKLPSGVVYKSITVGTGDTPKPTDTVRVNYKGTFTDGRMFDSSNGTPVEFELDHVIPCWTEGLQQMKVGGKAQLVCPSDQAYGEHGNRGIPGNSTLVFEVELLGVKPAGAPAAPGVPATPPPPAH